jgi:hypothetical protein
MQAEISIVFSDRGTARRHAVSEQCWAGGDIFMFGLMGRQLSLLVVLLPLLLWLCSGCSYVQGDYAVDLPNGYSLVRSNSSDIAIFGPPELYSSRVVPPLIVSIGVHENLVFGKVGDSQDLWLRGQDDLAKAEKAEQEKARGYFLLNTKTHAVKRGLIKEGWLDALKEQGVDSEPALKKPNRGFRY